MTTIIIANHDALRALMVTILEENGDTNIDTEFGDSYLTLTFETPDFTCIATFDLISSTFQPWTAIINDPPTEFTIMPTSPLFAFADKWLRLLILDLSEVRTMCRYNIYYCHHLNFTVSQHRETLVTAEARYPGIQYMWNILITGLQPDISMD